MKNAATLTIVTLAALFIITRKKPMGKITAANTVRKSDPFGQGHYGAPRGSRKHEGVDIVTIVGENIYSPIAGKVTRFPFPYGNDLSYTGIEIKNETYTIKIFYVKPTAKIGAAVSVGTKVAIAQNIAKKYGSTMINHCHVEVIENKTGKKLDYTKTF